MRKMVELIAQDLIRNIPVVMHYLAQLMATGVVGANGPVAPKLATLARKVELGLATAQRQRTMAKIVLPVTQMKQKLEHATPEVAQ